MCVCVCVCVEKLMTTIQLEGMIYWGVDTIPRVLVLCEMQSVLSRNWTRVAVSISCDDNHYTTGTFRTMRGDINNFKLTMDV